MQLAPGQCGLEHVTGIHGPFRLAGTDHGVQLVDEQNDVAFLLGKLVEHGLQPLFELAAELGTGNQRAHVQGQNTLVFQPFRYLTVENPLRQAFDDGRLTDAGLTDQHRIVLGSPLQHLHRAADFIVPADDRIEFALLRALSVRSTVYLASASRVSSALGSSTVSPSLDILMAS